MTRRDEIAAMVFQGFVIKGSIDSGYMYKAAVDMADQLIEQLDMPPPGKFEIIISDIDNEK